MSFVKPRTPLPNTLSCLRKEMVMDIPFFEGGGGTAYDFGQGLNTTLQGSAAWAMDTYGRALSLPGANTDYLLAKSGTLLATGTHTTIVMSFTTSQTPNGGGTALYCERAASGNDIWKLEMKTTASPVLQFTHRDDAGTLTQLFGSKVVNDGKPHTVWMYKRGTTIVGFVDGILDFSGTLTGTDTYTDSGLEVRIGGDKGDANAYFNGKVHFVYGWTRQLEAPALESLVVNPFQIYRQPQRPLANSIAVVSAWKLFAEEGLVLSA
jgi:hypothetical protein